MSAQKFEFGHFVFDARRRVLLRRGSKVRLPNKALEALSLLLNQAGKPVSKEDMHEALWGDSFVDDANLTQTIYVLRKTLGNGTPGKTMIRTVPKLGYEFVEPVNEVAASPGRRFIGWPAALSAAMVTAGIFVLYSVAYAPPTGGAESLLPTAALKAYELGRTAWINPSSASASRAIVQFKQVVKLAPRNPLGYDGLSDANLLLAGQSSGKTRRRFLNEAESLAREALALDPNSSEAHASIAQVLAFQRNPDAQQEFERAVALNPKNALAHRWFGEYWLMHAKFNEAYLELARSNALQPPVPQDLFWLGVAQYYARHFVDAAASFRETLAAGGSDPEIGLHLALAYDAKGDAPAALRELDVLQRARRDSANIHVVRASVLATHHPAAALKEISAALRSTKTEPVSAMSVAIALARAGKIDEGRTWLREHRVQSDETSIFPRFDPRLAGLRLYSVRLPV